MGLVSRLLNSEDQIPEYWYLKGKELCTSGYYLDGLEALDRMIATEPLHADSWLLKGYAHYQMGQYEEAMQFFDQSLSLNPHLHEALTYKGLILSNFGKHTEAIGLYNRALAVNASYAKAWYVKGLTFAILEQYADAISAFEKTLAIEPEHVDALAGISVAMKKHKKTKNLHNGVAPVPPATTDPQPLARPSIPVTPAIGKTPAPAELSGDTVRQQFIPAALYGQEDRARPVKRPAAEIAGQEKTADAKTLSGSGIIFLRFTP